MMLSEPQSSEGLVGAGGSSSHGDTHTRLFQFPSPQTSPQCCGVVSGHGPWLLQEWLIRDSKTEAPMSSVTQPWDIFAIPLSYLGQPSSPWAGNTQEHESRRRDTGSLWKAGCHTIQHEGMDFPLQNGVCSNLILLILKEVKVGDLLAIKKKKTQTCKNFFSKYTHTFILWNYPITYLGAICPFITLSYLLTLITLYLITFITLT